MAVFTASIFNPDRHRGDVIPVCQDIPVQYQGKFLEDHPVRQLLAPSPDLTRWWKKLENQAIDVGDIFPYDEAIDEFTKRYKKEILPRLKDIKAYIEGLDPSKDETWVDWEVAGAFNVRDLAIEFVKTFRPECFGGQDGEVVERGQERAEKKQREQASSVLPENLPPPKPQAIAHSFPVGQKVRLKGTKFVYEYVGDVPGNLTYNQPDNPYCELKRGDGKPAWWIKSQLEAVP